MGSKIYDLSSKVGQSGWRGGLLRYSSDIVVRMCSRHTSPRETRVNDGAPTASTCNIANLPNLSPIRYLWLDSSSVHVLSQ